MTVASGWEITAHGVVLDLSEACVQTAARHARRDLVDALLGDGAVGPETARAVALLDAFIRQSDFAALRAGDADLAGHAGSRVLLRDEGDGRVVLVKLDRKERR